MANDLISRKALLDTLQNHFGQDLAYLGEDLQYCQEAVQFAPSVEAVEVVRCAQCKSYRPESITVVRHCAVSGIQVEDDDYCSCGERREPDEE